MSHSKGSIYTRPNSSKYWIKYYDNGVCHRKSTDIEIGPKDAKRKAKEFLDKTMKEVYADVARYGDHLGPRAQRVTTRELISAWQEQKLSDSIRNRQDVDKGFYSNFKRADEWFGQYRALDLTEKFWGDWIRKDGAKLLREYAPATLNRTVEIVRAALNFATRARMIPAMPVDFRVFRKKGQHGILFDERGNVRRGFFEHEEFLRLLAATTDSDLRDYFTFGYLMGWRSGSIKSLRWPVVDLQANWIELEGREAKEGHKNVMPLGLRGDVLYDLVHRRAAVRVGDYVFHRAGCPIGDIRKAWARACKRAGLAGRLFHDFRRTAARNIFIATDNKDYAKLVTGHKTDEVFDRYNIILDAQKLQAIRETWAHLTTRGQIDVKVPTIGHILGTAITALPANTLDLVSVN